MPLSINDINMERKQFRGALKGPNITALKNAFEHRDTELNHMINKKIFCFDLFNIHGQDEEPCHGYALDVIGKLVGFNRPYVSELSLYKILAYYRQPNHQGAPQWEDGRTLHENSIGNWGIHQFYNSEPIGYWLTHKNDIKKLIPIPDDLYRLLLKIATIKTSANGTIQDIIQSLAIYENGYNFRVTSPDCNQLLIEFQRPENDLDRLIFKNDIYESYSFNIVDGSMIFPFPIATVLTIKFEEDE